MVKDLMYMDEIILEVLDPNSPGKTQLHFCSQLLSEVTVFVHLIHGFCQALEQAAQVSGGVTIPRDV